jgi:hypothetical protein
MADPARTQGSKANQSKHINKAQHVISTNVKPNITQRPANPFPFVCQDYWAGGRMSELDIYMQGRLYYSPSVRNEGNLASASVVQVLPPSFKGED